MVLTKLNDLFKLFQKDPLIDFLLSKTILHPDTDQNQLGYKVQKAKITQMMVFYKLKIILLLL